MEGLSRRIESHKASFVADEYGNAYITVPLDRYEELIASETKLNVIEIVFLNDGTPLSTDILQIIGSEASLDKIKKINEASEKMREKWAKRHADPDDNADL